MIFFKFLFEYTCNQFYNIDKMFKIKLFLLFFKDDLSFTSGAFRGQKTIGYYCSGQFSYDTKVIKFCPYINCTPE